jgi:O-antigen/teichoic acid export membrane protein
MSLSGFIATSIYHNAALTGQLMLASATVILYALFNLTLATLIAIDKAKEGTIMYLLYAFIQLFAAVALVLLGYGVVGAIAGMAIGLIIPSIIGIFIIAKFLDGRFTRPSWTRTKELVDFSAPVLASNVALFVPTNLAILLLGVYASALTVGNYNAAFRFGSFVSVVLVSISFVLLPAFSKAFSDKDMASKIGKIYNSSIYYTLLLLLPLLVYAVSVSHPLMYLLFSSRYTLAPFYFAVIAIGSTIGIVGTYASNLQVGYGDTRKFMYYQLLAVAIQVVLLFALTPTFGADGALLALFVISQILIGIIYVHVLYKQFAFKHETGRVIRLVVPSAILLVALYFLTLALHNSMLALVTNLVAVIALFPPIVAVFGGVKRENVEFVREIGKRLKIQKPLNYILDYAEFFIRGKSIKPNPSS